MKNNFESSLGTISYELINSESKKHLLLIHGFMEDHEVWNELKSNLSINIITVDLLGFGESKPSPSFNFSMKQQAQAIHELLNELNPKNLYVLGHSMGGYIALELLALRPEINIGLLHSTYIADNDERFENRNKTIEVLEKDPSVFIREFYWNLFAEHRKNEFTAIIESMKAKAEKIPTSYIIETVKALRDRADNTELIQNADGDNIMIAGTYDKLLKVGELEELAHDGVTDWAEMEDSGHMGFYEEPEILRDIVRYWIEI